LLIPTKLFVLHWHYTLVYDNHLIFLRFYLFYHWGINFWYNLYMDYGVLIRITPGSLTDWKKQHIHSSTNCKKSLWNVQITCFPKRVYGVFFSFCRYQIIIKWKAMPYMTLFSAQIIELIFTSDLLFLNSFPRLPTIWFQYSLIKPRW
jgi:hypothetical protein